MTLQDLKEDRKRYADYVQQDKMNLMRDKLTLVHNQQMLKLIEDQIKEMESHEQSSAELIQEITNGLK